MELAGQQMNLCITEVMAKRAACEADLFAAAGNEKGRIQLGQAFLGLEEGRSPAGSGAISFCSAAEGLWVGGWMAGFYGLAC